MVKIGNFVCHFANAVRSGRKKKKQGTVRGERAIFEENLGKRGRTVGFSCLRQKKAVVVSLCEVLDSCLKFNFLSFWELR